MSNSFFQNKFFLRSLLVVSAIAAGTFFMLNKKAKYTTKNIEYATKEKLNDRLKLTAFYKNEEAKPFINPPLQGITIPFAVYTVVVKNGATLQLPTGSTIVIPKNAFADQNGNILKGNVQINCREFKNAVDFFVAGIPMTYDSAGVRYQFESAGMIEIMGYQNGKQINFAPKKTMDVALTSTNKSKEYKLYKIDTVKNNWACLGKDEVRITKNPSIQPQSKVQKNTAFTTQENKIIEQKKTTIELQKETQLAALHNAIEPKKPVKANDTKFNFNLEVDVREFPELAIYNGLLFQVGNENKNFNAASYNIIWDDATITEGTKKGENYLLTLKKGPKKYSFIVYPVFEGKNYNEALKIYQEKYKNYATLFAKKMEDEKRIEAEYQSKLTVLKKQEITIQRKWEDEGKQEFNRMNTQEKIKRVFAINSFGVYNCDNAIPYPKGVSCIADLMINKKQRLICYDIFLVDSAKNALFNFYKNPVINFSYNPQSKNILWTVENGILYWLKPEQFKDIKSDAGKAELLMNRVDKKFKTAEEIKAFFNL